jgi:ribosomal protein L6P/L9E
MSRIGRLPITVPASVDVTIDGRNVTVKGPKGTLEYDAPADITIAREGDDLVVSRPDDERESRALQRRWKHALRSSPARDNSYGPAARRPGPMGP